jgi:hypothetical protein
MKITDRFLVNRASEPFTDYGILHSQHRSGAPPMKPR